MHWYLISVKFRGYKQFYLENENFMLASNKTTKRFEFYQLLRYGAWVVAGGDILRNIEYFRRERNANNHHWIWIGITETGLWMEFNKIQLTRYGGCICWGGW